MAYETRLTARAVTVSPANEFLTRRLRKRGSPSAPIGRESANKQVTGTQSLASPPTAKRIFSAAIDPYISMMGRFRAVRQESNTSTKLSKAATGPDQAPRPFQTPSAQRPGTTDFGSW